MKFIKIVFFSIAFYFFAPVNGYAIVQTYEKPKSEIRKIRQNDKSPLIGGIIFLALGIYPFVKGIILYQAAGNIVSVSAGVLMLGVGGLLVLIGLIGIIGYFIEKYRRSH